MRIFCLEEDVYESGTEIVPCRSQLHQDGDRLICPSHGEVNLAYFVTPGMAGSAHPSQLLAGASV